MRILGVNIPDNKRADIALSYVYGVGRFSAAEILKSTGIDPAKKAGDFTQEEVGKVQAHIDQNFKVEGELRQIVRQNVNQLKDMKSYRGVRHLHKLPVRGQRTKTNSRTVRGNVRKTAGSGKRKLELK